MTNLDSILKSRDITLPTKVHLVKAMVFPMVMYGCESWTVKKAERQKIDAFELWCWRRLLRVPWTARRSNQSVHPKGDQSWVFIGRTDAEAETPNTLTTSCEELTHWKRPWCWERLKAGGEGDDRGWDGWMASPTGWTWVWVNSGSWWWTGRPGVLWFMGSQKSWTQLNWTDWCTPGNMSMKAQVLLVRRTKTTDEENGNNLNAHVVGRWINYSVFLDWNILPWLKPVKQIYMYQHRLIFKILNEKISCRRIYIVWYYLYQFWQLKTVLFVALVFIKILFAT